MGLQRQPAGHKILPGPKPHRTFGERLQKIPMRCPTGQTFKPTRSVSNAEQPLTHQARGSTAERNWHAPLLQTKPASGTVTQCWEAGFLAPGPASKSSSGGMVGAKALAELAGPNRCDGGVRFLVEKNPLLWEVAGCRHSGAPEKKENKRHRGTGEDPRPTATSLRFERTSRTGPPIQRCGVAHRAMTPPFKAQPAANPPCRGGAQRLLDGPVRVCKTRSAQPLTDWDRPPAAIRWSPTKACCSSRRSSGPAPIPLGAAGRAAFSAAAKHNPTNQNPYSH